VKVPRVRDRGAYDDKITFTPSILPRYLRKAKSIEDLLPWLYLIPAGFLIAALVWILPRMESAGEMLIIMIVTYVIGLGGMSHVVAGSTELFILVARGELEIGAAVFGGILPALAGNVLGGTGIFVALTYAQVREEV
jgi:formate/nitrite transporter FocA (FNT family)